MYSKAVLATVNTAFLLYRKFLKLSEIVYNEQEIENDMTKERMWDSP